LDLTDGALSAAEKGYTRMMESYRTLMALFSNVPKSDSPLAKELEAGIQDAFDEMNDDFNVPKSLARLFELCTTINKLVDGQLKVDDAGQHSLDIVKQGFKTLLIDVFGLLDEADSLSDDHMAQLDGLMQFIIEMRQKAREQKDWGTSDKIRDTLASIDIELKDGKEGTKWGFKK
jgi:cysteinyl-tRNA synthetase